MSKYFFIADTHFGDEGIIKFGYRPFVNSNEMDEQLIKNWNEVVTEESYTSKCSFIDNEEIKKKDIYDGKRTKRGLYRSKEGKLINADINGSYNIMRKGLKKVALDDKVTYPECRGFVYNPDKFNLK